MFFGRDGDRARALDRLKDSAEAGFPFLLIVGPSGAGKSSFARAGVLPWLVKPGAVAGVGVWRTAVMRPSDHPDGAIASLARHLFDAANDTPEPETGRPIALPELNQGDSATPQALAGLFSVFARGKFERGDDLESAGRAAMAPIEKALKSVTGAERKAFGDETEQPAHLLLVVDQLDELFAAGVDEATRTAMARLLDRLARTGLIWILATLRAELYEAFLKSPLARLASPDNTQYGKRLELTFDLLPPGLTEMAEVVRGPARAAGLEWEVDPVSKERLDERLFADIDRPDLLPLVQSVLDRLYEQRAAKGDTVALTFDAYRALGTLDGAIDLAAEKALSALGPAERAALPRLLRALVAYSGGKGAAALLQTPRTIATHDEVSTRLVDALIEARILVSGQDQNKTPTIALAHQRVIEAWKRAQTIVSESESMLRIRDEMEDARRRWEVGGQRRDRLIPAGLPLSEAENATVTLGDELPVLTRTYVEKSGRAARSRQRLTAAAAVIFLAVAAVAVFLWKEAGEAARSATQAAGEAQKQTLVANLEKDKAQRNQSAALVALSTIALPTNPTRAVKLALAAWPRHSREQRTPNLEIALRGLCVALEQSRERKIFQGHDGKVWSAAFSPDGTRIVTASDDKTARIWDPASGKQIAVLSGHDAAVWSAAFSPDGTRVVTASNEKAARVWDAVTGKALAVLSGHGGVVYSASFSPDGSRIVTASGDMLAHLWDTASGKEVAILGGHANTVYSASFSPDGSRIVTASSDATGTLWDAASGRELAILSGHHGQIHVAAFSPDGTRVVTASYDKTARLWDAATGKELATLSCHNAAVMSATFSPDGTHVVTGSLDRTARLWNAATGEELATLSGHEGEVWRAAFSPGGRHVITASWDKTARLWDAAKRPKRSRSCAATTIRF